MRPTKWPEEILMEAVLVFLFSLRRPDQIHIIMSVFSVLKDEPGFVLGNNDDDPTAYRRPSLSVSTAQCMMTEDIEIG